MAMQTLTLESGTNDWLSYFLHNHNIETDINIKKNRLLHYAANQGMPHIVYTLLKAGAPCNVYNEKYETPLEISAKSDVQRIILDHFSNININTLHNPFIYNINTNSSYSILFWTALYYSRDKDNFPPTGIYPFEHLSESEKILLLYDISRMLLDNATFDVNILSESALFAIYAFIKIHVKREIEQKVNDNYSYFWRTLVINAWESIYSASAESAGLKVTCARPSIWNTVINLLARVRFGETIWIKKRMFSVSHAEIRPFLLSNFAGSCCDYFPALYFSSRTPSCQLPEAIVFNAYNQLLGLGYHFGVSGLKAEDAKLLPSFKDRALGTISQGENFYLDNAKFSNFYLNFNYWVSLKQDHHYEIKVLQEIFQWDDDILSSVAELAAFWASLSMEDKWALTEISTSELFQIMKTDQHWEILRLAYESYSRYSQDDDLLDINISDELITIADLDQMVMWEQCLVALAREHQRQLSVLLLMSSALSATPSSSIICICANSQNSSEIEHSTMHHFYQHQMYCPQASCLYFNNNGSANSIEILEQAKNLKLPSEGQWDKNHRKLLEQVVLSEFARKVSRQYLMQQQELNRNSEFGKFMSKFSGDEEFLTAEEARKRKKAKANKEKKKRRLLKKKANGQKDDEEDNDISDDDDSENVSSQNIPSQENYKDPVVIATALIEELELEQKKNASKINNSTKNNKNNKNSKKKKVVNKQQKNLKSYDDSSESEPEIVPVKSVSKKVETHVKNLDLFNSDDSDDGSEEIKISPPKLYSRSKSNVRNSNPKNDIRSQPNFKESSRALLPSLDSFPTLSAALTSNKNPNQPETKNMFRIVSTTIESNPASKIQITKSHNNNFNKMSVPTKTSVHASKAKVETNIKITTDSLESKPILVSSPKINSIPINNISDISHVEFNASSPINSIQKSLISNLTQNQGTSYQLSNGTFDSTSFSAPATPCKNNPADNLLLPLNTNFNSSSLPSSPLKSLIENQNRSVLNLNASKRLNFSTNAPVFIPSMPFNSSQLNLSAWTGDSPKLQSFPPTIPLSSISSLSSNNVHPTTNWNGQLLPQTTTNVATSTTSASSLRLGLNFNGPSIW